MTSTCLPPAPRFPTEPIQAIALHEDAFYEYFRPYRHPSAKHDIWGGHGLETFGPDLDLVKSLPRENIWTIVDGAGGDDLWIIPDLHYVNRVCYLVTEVAHNGAPLEFRVPHRCSTLTPLGVLRQINKIRRLIGQSTCT